MTVTTRARRALTLAAIALTSAGITLGGASVYLRGHTTPYARAWAAGYRDGRADRG